MFFGEFSKCAVFTKQLFISIDSIVSFSARGIHSITIKRFETHVMILRYSQVPQVHHHNRCVIFMGGQIEFVLFVNLRSRLMQVFGAGAGWPLMLFSCQDLELAVGIGPVESMPPALKAHSLCLFEHVEG